jgi:hypothetical protein
MNEFKRRYNFSDRCLTFSASVLTVLLVIVTFVPSITPQNIVKNALAVSNNNTSSKIASQKFLVYQNDTYGISIQYPASWSSSGGEGGNDSADSSVDLISFSPPNNNNSDSATVDLLVDNVDSGVSIQQYMSDSISSDKTDLQSFKVDETTLNGTLAKLPAYKFLYTYTDQGQNFKGLETGTIVGNKAYYIQYENSPAQFNTDLPVVQEMIDSIKIVRK